MRYRKEEIPESLWMVFLLAVLLFSIFGGLMLGSLKLGIGEIFQALFSLESTGISIYRDVIWDVRLPRVILSMAAGMGLALSGVIMQAMFRNPMASPYVMGVSSGAALGAVIAIFFGGGVTFGMASVGLGSFCGALFLSILMVVAIGKYGGNTEELLIMGVALSAVCSGITGVIIFLGAESSGMDVTLYWLMGSIAFAKLNTSLLLLLFVLVMVAFFMTQRRVLNLMLLGPEQAVSLGWDLLPFFKLYIILNASLVGAVVMQAGIIAFAGFVVPHFVRSFFGADHKSVVPLSVLCGGILTVWADILGRTIIKGGDIPIGIMLAFIGAPLLMYMLVKKSYRFGGGLP